MKNLALRTHAARRTLLAALVTTCAFGLAVSRPEAAHADDDAAPLRVPGNLQVPAGNRVFFAGRGVGTQNYICLPAGAGFAWTLFTPQATLFGRGAKQLTTHFFSPNPDENGTIRATWQHSRDTSTVWAQLAPDGSSSDADFVAPGAIPWLLLQKAGTQEGRHQGDTLAVTTYIQRVNTLGGVAPATGCAVPANIGSKAFVPYEADYIFYTYEDRR